VEHIEILEGAEGYVLGEGKTAALFCHGFTSSPQNMRGLADYLAERGIAVRAPLLPGHGTTWQDLNSKRTEDWIGAVEDAFHELVASNEEVFLVGLSFGGALALDLAARYPDQVAGIVTLGGFVATKDPRRFLAPVIRKVAKSLPGVGNDIANPDLKEIVYDRFPTSAAYYMLRQVKKARLGLPAVTAPILVMHGRNDHTVPPFNGQLIYDTVSSTDKELVWLERSYHVVTLDHDRDEVFDRTYRFIAEHSKALRS
jgi:carboxylesterase